jgi:small-conductance mechanosensitive channel
MLSIIDEYSIMLPMFYNGVTVQLNSITSFLEKLGAIIISVLPQIFISTIAIVIGFFFIRLTRKTIENRMKDQRLGEHLSYTLIKLIQWATILIVTSIILFQFGLNLAAITGFLSVIGGTIIGFAAVNTLGNAIAGFIIMISRPFKVGDRIYFNGRFSDVITINLIYTKLRTLDLVYVSVPNQELIRKELDNYGKKNIIRQSITVTADYVEPRNRITDILLDAVDGVPLVLKAPLPYVSITDFQSYAMEYTLFYFIREVKRMPWIEADVRSRVVDVFNENGIDLTTPLISKRFDNDETQKNISVKTHSITHQVDSKQVDIRNIEGIGSVYSEKLNSIYIYSVEDLLEAGKTREGRIDLANKTGISSKLILRWINLADLFRLDGVGKEYSGLLEAAGVDTVVELSRRNPRNLYRRLVQENAARNLVETVPSRDFVEAWVKEAKTLPRKILY